MKYAPYNILMPPIGRLCEFVFRQIYLYAYNTCRYMYKLGLLATEIATILGQNRESQSRIWNRSNFLFALLVSSAEKDGFCFYKKYIKWKCSSLARCFSLLFRTLTCPNTHAKTQINSAGDSQQYRQLTCMPNKLKGLIHYQQIGKNVCLKFGNSNSVKSSELLIPSDLQIWSGGGTSLL